MRYSQGSSAKMHPDQWVGSVISTRSCRAWRVLAIKQLMLCGNLQILCLPPQIKHSSKAQGPDFSCDYHSAALSPVWCWAWVQDSAQCLGTGGCGCGPGYRRGLDPGNSYGGCADSVADCCGITPNDDDWSSWWPSGTDGSRVPPPHSQWPSARGRRLQLTDSTSMQGLAALPLCLLLAPSQTWHPLEGRRTHY